MTLKTTICIQIALLIPIESFLPIPQYMYEDSACSWSELKVLKKHLSTVYIHSDGCFIICMNYLLALDSKTVIQ